MSPPGEAPGHAPKQLGRMVSSLSLALLLTASPVGAQELQDGRIRAQLVAERQTTLSSELSASISQLPLKEGQAFQEGQLLAQFDCSVLQAQLSKAEAAAEVARRTLQVNTRLAELNAISTLEVDQASAKVKETEAEVAMIRVTAAKCTLKAPFAGRIAKLHVEPHQYVTAGKPLLDILDTSRLEIRLIVPSAWLRWLKANHRFSVRVEELGRVYPARVLRLGARIDPLSQTIPITGVVEGLHPELIPGMSGWATFEKGRP